MLQYVFDEYILIYVMFGICGLGVFLKLVISLVYRRLLRASDKMGTSKNKLMKTMCQKFETSYALNMGVNNVDTFVDKYVYRHRFCGILLYTWENFCGLLLLLCMLTGSIGALLAILAGCGEKVALSTFFIGICTSAVLVFVDNFANLSTKKGVLRVNIQDYLENCLKVRLDAGREVKLQEKEAANMQQTMAEEMDKEKAVKKEDKLEEDVSKMYEVNQKEEKIIEDILKEYIV